MNANLSAGKFLVSDPFLPDENFKRSVVYLVQHNENGSVGLVLNQLLPQELDAIFPDFPEKIPLFQGGPVEQDTIMILHNLSELENSLQSIPGIYWAGSFEQLKFMFSEGLCTPSDVKFFKGYSGWGAGQLEAELEEKSWILLPADASLIFESAPENLYKDVLIKSGGIYRNWAIAPEFPHLN